MRGDVYRLKRPRSAQGHEQQGERYAVVVQANAYDHLSTWLVAPTTTKSFGSMIHPTIELLGQDVRVLVEQTTAVDPQRLGDFAGRLAPEELTEINVAQPEFFRAMDGSEPSGSGRIGFGGYEAGLPGKNLSNPCWTNEKEARTAPSCL